MTEQTRDGALHRRNFLRSIGGVSTLAVAAVAGPLAPVEATAQTAKPDPRRSRYKESEHVKAFYRVNRY